jgi:hypothetical protein
VQAFYPDPGKLMRLCSVEDLGTVWQLQRKG